MVKSNKKTKVSIVVLTINSLSMVKETLLSISKLRTDGLELSCIVVDNGSTDGTGEELRKYKIKNVQYKFIQTGKNLGFSAGNNVGIKYALGVGAEYVLLLNDDMVLKPDLIVNLVSFMESNPKTGIVSPKIYFAPGYEFHRDRYSKNQKGKVIWYAGGKVDWNNIYTSHIGVDEVDIGQFKGQKQTELASGACMMVRSEVFNKVGYLDEGLFLYWEDADYSLRTRKNDYLIYCDLDTSVWHKVSASAGGSGSKSNDYFLVRNRYYFALKYAKLRTKVAVLKDTLRLSLFGREWQRIGAKDALMGKKGAGPWVKK